jgi:sodium transport system ATP-binding protein
MSNHIIKIQNISKHFKGSDRWALKDLSFNIEEGEIIGLIGENGAGKSTTMRIMATIMKPTSGRMEIAGYDVSAHPGDVRRAIGILFGQNSGLYDRLSARENILYYANLNGLTDRKVDKQLSEISELLEMEDFLDLKAGAFSTGMRQKTLIARAIIHNPKVLILDEPATGLDVTSSRNIYQFIKTCKELKKTVIFSSHDLGAVEKISDRVLILHKGDLLASGPPAEIIKEGSLEDQFVIMQEAIQ